MHTKKHNFETIVKSRLHTKPQPLMLTRVIWWQFSATAVRSWSSTSFMPASRRTSSEGQLAAISAITSTENYKRNQSKIYQGRVNSILHDIYCCCSYKWFIKILISIGNQHPWTVPLTENILNTFPHIPKNFSDNHANLIILLNVPSPLTHEHNYNIMNKIM